MAPNSIRCARPWLDVLADTPAYSVMFTSRGVTGGCPDPYADFNLCHYTGDSSAHVGDCRRRLAETLGIAAECIIVPRQIHSVNVAVIDSLPVDAEALEGADGVVTSLPGVAVGVSTADCVPIVAVDPVARVAGAFHAGWRGAVGGIVAEGIAAMTASGADVGRIEAYIGPSICCECFEVGEEVAGRFPTQFVVRRESWLKPHVDLPGHVVGELTALGVRPENISAFSRNFCTRCHPDKYFSARAEGIRSGRNFTFAILKSRN